MNDEIHDIKQQVLANARKILGSGRRLSVMYCEDALDSSCHRALAPIQRWTEAAYRLADAEYRNLQDCKGWDGWHRDLADFARFLVDYPGNDGLLLAVRCALDGIDALREASDRRARLMEENENYSWVFSRYKWALYEDLGDRCVALAAGDHPEDIAHHLRIGHVPELPSDALAPPE